MEILSPRRQSLSIEARHTISLEVAKQRRLKVPSSLFLPSKPLRQIIPISSEHEKQTGNTNPKKKTKRTKKEELSPVGETPIETKAVEGKKESAKKQIPSKSKESKKEKNNPSNQILFLTGNSEAEKLILPKKTRTTKSAKEEKETLTISCESGNGEEDLCPSNKNIVSTTEEEKERKHCTDKEEDSFVNLSEISKVLFLSAIANSTKERKSSSYKQILTPSSESGKHEKDPSCQKILALFLEQIETKRKNKSTESEKGEEDRNPLVKEIKLASSNEKESQKYRKEQNWNKEESTDKHKLSETSSLSKKIQSSPEQVEIETEILPSPIDVDKEKENPLELITCRASEESVSEEITFHEETFATETIKDSYSENQNVKDKTSDKVEIPSRNINKEIEKRSPLKQILARTRATEIEMSKLYGKKNRVKEVRTRSRRTNQKIETAVAVEGMAVPNKVTPAIFFLGSAPTGYSSTNVESQAYLVNSDPNVLKQFQVTKVHNPMYTTETMPQYGHLFQYQGQDQSHQVVSKQMPTNMFQNSANKGDIYEYEHTQLPNNRNVFAQKCCTNNNQYAPERPVRDTNSETSDEVHHVTRYYNDNAQVQSYPNLCRHDDLRYQPYDLSQRRPREYIQPSQFEPELPSLPYHNQKQFDQGPVHKASSTLPHNYITNWTAMNTPNQVALPNPTIQSTQQMSSSSYQNNIPLWLQQSINNLKLSNSAINRPTQPAQMVQSTSHQSTAFHEHPAQMDVSKWIQPSINQGPFQPTNNHPSMHRWPNNCRTTFGSPTLMHHEPEIPSFGYPNTIQAGNAWYPVPMNSTSENRERSAFAAPNLQPPIRHEEAPMISTSTNTNPYLGPLLYHADSTTGENSPPLPASNMQSHYIEPITCCSNRPTFCKPEAHRPSLSPYSRIKHYPLIGQGSLNNMPEYDPRRNR